MALKSCVCTGNYENVASLTKRQEKETSEA